MRHSAIYPGTFDPLTLGHLDLIERAAHIFDRVVVAVVVNSRKNTVYTAEERVAMVRASIRNLKNVKVEAFDGLLVTYARRKGIHVLLRGLRAFSDFEYEFQMALTNRTMAPEIETMFLMPKETYSYINSSTVREVVERGGDISKFVPPAVQRLIARKLGKPVRSRAVRIRK